MQLAQERSVSKKVSWSCRLRLCKRVPSRICVKTLTCCKRFLIVLICFYHNVPFLHVADIKMETDCHRGDYLLKKTTHTQ